MKINILGCGWLGFPLAKHLLKNGHQVQGSTTTESKINEFVTTGLKPVLLKFTPKAEGNLADFLACDTLVISIPPRAGKYGDDFHVQQIESIIEAFEATKPQSIIYISSTSVYPETNQELDESAATLPNSALVKVEELLKNTGKPCTILRCGGLMGYDRIPAKYVAGKKISNGHIPVNFVHQDDVVGIISLIIEQQILGKIYNVVAPQNPLRIDVYQKTCEDFGYEVPIFEDDETIPFKIISPEKLILETGYKFIFPDPLGFRYS